MNRFLSTKNTYTVAILWSLVLFLLILLCYGITKEHVELVPAIILFLATGFIIWVLLDTRYVIKNNLLLYRSGPIRGNIDITKIKKIKSFSGLNVPVILKPALDIKGFIVTYNAFDDVFISPSKSELFIAELKKINPNIEVL
ncbi:MAG: PH domain-containing protein [Flavobacterium sp.]|nr:PH domain-containing protein [Flavobacterium sp.]